MLWITGEFTCEIEDYGYAQRKSVTVDVIRLPRVSLTPMVVNLLEGQATLFRCLSTDDTMMTFTYQVVPHITHNTHTTVHNTHPSYTTLRVACQLSQYMTHLRYTCRATLMQYYHIYIHIYIYIEWRRSGRKLCVLTCVNKVDLNDITLSRLC